jgi:threonylcarbamoyladenosine tRNA methylthiotransferase MtaB
MPQLARELVKARAARLRSKAAERRSHWLDSLVGLALPVLVESGEKGHSDTFAPVAVPGAPRGATGLLRVAARDGDHLVGAFG